MLLYTQAYVMYCVFVVALYISIVLVINIVIIYYCCYWLLLTVVSVADVNNQFQSINQAVGNASGGGQKQWDDEDDESPSPTSGVSTYCVIVIHQSHLSIALSQSN